MTVNTTDYGTFKTHEGSITEVAGAMAGVPASHIIAFFVDAAGTAYIAVQKTTA